MNGTSTGAAVQTTTGPRGILSVYLRKDSCSCILWLESIIEISAGSGGGREAAGGTPAPAAEGIWAKLERKHVAATCVSHISRFSVQLLIKYS